MKETITIKLLKTIQRGYEALSQDAKLMMSDFILTQRCKDGGFINKQGEQDLYYTTFGSLLQYVFGINYNTGELKRYLDSIDADNLDLIHYAAYMRCRLLASVTDSKFPGVLTSLISQKNIRSEESFEVWPNNDKNAPYSRFIWLSLLEDTNNSKQHTWLSEEYAIKGGGYSNVKGQDSASVNATAAALMVKGQNEGYDKTAQNVLYLLNSQLPSGGFKASPQTHMPDLLSTATALFTLLCYDVQPRYSAQEFVEAHWLDNGGFGATILDSNSDVEYLFYGLLALGTL